MRVFFTKMILLGISGIFIISVNPLPEIHALIRSNMVFQVFSSFSVYLLPDIHASKRLVHPLFVVSNGEKMPYLGPEHLFVFEKCCLKSDHFLMRPIQKIHQGVARRGMCPFCLGV
jgi:hypothetical protein